MQNPSEGSQNIDEVNSVFYNASGESFDKIPFESILPDLLLKYGTGKEVLEIGSGALASWLERQGCKVACIEPAKELAKKAAAKGLKVYPMRVQDFLEDQLYDSAIAISSLIHVPKADLPLQIRKIARLLKPGGMFFVSFIEGEGEGFEDPTQIGRSRYFAKWKEDELEHVTSSYFSLLENHRVYNQRMDRTFSLRVYILK